MRLDIRLNTAFRVPTLSVLLLKAEAIFDRFSDYVYVHPLQVNEAIHYLKKIRTINTSRVLCDVFLSDY
jgi:hypothetical protein